MKHHPILMSGPMVRAILSGDKTETRRPSDIWRKVKPGDQLWVRETWAPGDDLDPPEWLWYRADMTLRSLEGKVLDDNSTGDAPEKWRPAIHMPRDASRLLLEVISNHQEPLRDITDADAIAEGMLTVSAKDLIQISAKVTKRKILDSCKRQFNLNQNPTWEAFSNRWKCMPARTRFALGIEAINGPGTWASNPLVWVPRFKVVR